jgi:hypothetical protein
MMLLPSPLVDDARRKKVFALDSLKLERASLG